MAGGYLPPVGSGSFGTSNYRSTSDRSNHERLVRLGSSVSSILEASGRDGEETGQHADRVRNAVSSPEATQQRSQVSETYDKVECMVGMMAVMLRTLPPPNEGSSHDAERISVAANALDLVGAVCRIARIWANFEPEPRSDN